MPLCFYKLLSETETFLHRNTAVVSSLLLGYKLQHFQRELRPCSGGWSSAPCRHDHRFPYGKRPGVWPRNYPQWKNISRCHGKQKAPFPTPCPKTLPQAQQLYLPGAHTTLPRFCLQPGLKGPWLRQNLPPDLSLRRSARARFPSPILAGAQRRFQLLGSFWPLLTGSK